MLSLVPWLIKSKLHDSWHGRYHASAQRLFQLPLLSWPRGAEDGKELFDMLFTFTFVRHPFVRLVSAYQDKVCYNQFQKL
jgi:hypothetical protein